MPLRAWLTLLVVLILVGLLLNVPGLPALATTIVGVLLAASWWQRHALRDVNYRRYLRFTRAFPGERVPLSIEVVNDKLLPLSWLRIRDPWPKAVGPVDENILGDTHLPDLGELTTFLGLRWYERVRRNYELLFRNRGVHTIGPALGQSGDLFGIYSTEKELARPQKLVVFPKLIPLPKLDLPAERPFGDLRSRRRMFEDPSRPMGVRQYHPEDGFRRIHWPATARTGQLQVRVFQPTSSQVMVVCLNAATALHSWEGADLDLLEYLVSVAATIAHQGFVDGYQVGLISNGTSSTVSPGRAAQHLPRLLQSLAGISPLVIAPFDRYLYRQVPRVPFGSTLVVISAVITSELAETLVRLKERGRRMVLISLEEKPPQQIPGVRSIHLPFKAYAAREAL